MKITEVRFADVNLREAFNKLEKGTSEERELYNRISKVIQILEKNPEAGIRIKKKLIPVLYVNKYAIDNLWKCNLGDKWRLLYAIAQDEIRLISVILEWLAHKGYERRFGYG
jgi:Txe/YoeB family toxin of Txe-Axe toxin-antitoxin module